MKTKKNTTKKEEVKQHLQSVGDKMPLKNKLVGGSGAFGLLGGTAGKAAKGALNIIKNLVKRKKTSNSGGSQFREIANKNLREGLNKGDKKNLTY